MKTTYLTLLTLFLTSASRAAPNERSVSLREVTAIALASNPAIKQALATWEAKKKRITQEAAWDDLRFSAMTRTARSLMSRPMQPAW